MTIETTGALLTVDQVAHRLGVGRSTVFVLLGRGDIASVRIGRLRRVTEASLHDYVQKLTTDAR